MNATTYPQVAFPGRGDCNSLSPVSPGGQDVRLAAPGSSPGPQEEARAPLRVVAADGDPDARAFYRGALPGLGHEAVVAETGPQLVEQCRLLRPDLVIADVQLPGMDAIAAADEVCR